MPKSTKNKLNVLPRKDLFIYMVVKDIDINKAVLDLVDNSVDGAKRKRQDGNFEGLIIDITFTQEEFRIEDNCGGIPADRLEYTFQFGRDEEDLHDTATAAIVAQERKLGLIGRYGLGMKRAIFKLGRKFRVDSSDGKTRFVVDVNVNEWRKKNKKEDWTFPVQILSELMLTPGTEEPRDGTTITITALLDEVKAQFKREKFIKDLIKDIGQRQEKAMEKGLEITINNKKVDYRPGSLLKSENVLPAYEPMTLKGRRGNEIKVEIYAGLAQQIGRADQENSTSDTGWYIYGNGRLIIRADKTSLTGWGEQGSIRIPQHHFQFARFRGYVFFTSDDASDIPWDTTKTGIDQDASIFQAVRQRMLVHMRHVIDLLNKLKNEREGSVGEDLNKGPIALTIKGAKPVALDDLPRKSQRFTVTISEEIARKISDKVKITYQKSIDEVNRLRQCLNIDDANEIGAKTFNYYLEQVCDD